MPIWAVQLIAQLFPTVVAMLAPIFTALLEKITGKTDATVPNPAKPAINAGFGVGLAAMVGGTPAEGIVGAMLGNRIREAMAGKKPVPS